MDKKTYFEVG